MNTDNIDKFGHCVVCHKNLLTKRVVDGKIIDMFLPIYSDTVFLLDNGSQMQVTICKICKESTDLNDPQVHSEIMEAVMKGWELETKMLVADEKQPDWTEEKGKKYLDTMAQLNIDCNSEDLGKYAIQQKQIKLLKLKVDKVKSEVINVINNDS